MTLINTAQLSAISRTSSESHQVYCGLDNAVMLEVLSELHHLRNRPPEIYNFERALQAPYLEIMNRGFAIDELSRHRAVAELTARKTHLESILNELAYAVWDRPLNPRSPTQLKEFFYSKMRLPEVIIRQKGESKLSTNREALEKLDVYLHARPIVSLILTIRDISKQLDVFTTEIDTDGRYRTSYNIAGTETGRPSSSENAFGTGGNAQNIAPGLRYVFVADQGKKLAQIDLEQVEARDVGWFCGVLFNDWTFLDACESGDLHTNNAKRIWRNLEWTGEKHADRQIADRIFYRDFSYRDMAKRGSHLSNYMGTAWTAGRSLKVPTEIMEEFQARYCRGPSALSKRLLQQKPELRDVEPAYPCIAKFWQWIATEIQTTYSLTTPFGRQRHFFGRPGDDTTLREAIAFLPQSTTADRMNLGLWKVWKSMPQVELLAQTYDSITFQFDERLDEDAIMEEALSLIRVNLSAPGRPTYIVPGEAKVGWNWGYQVTESDVERAKLAGRKIPRLNLDGLAKWKPGGDGRKRHVGLERRIQ